MRKEVKYGLLFLKINWALQTHYISNFLKEEIMGSYKVMFKTKFKKIFKDLLADK